METPKDTQPRGCLIIYHADGSVWGSFPPLVRYSPDNLPMEYVDWEARETANLEVTDLLRVTTPGDDDNPPIKGAKHWPEMLDSQQLHEMRVELEGQPGRKHIARLVAKDGTKRENPKVRDGIEPNAKRG